MSAWPTQVWRSTWLEGLDADGCATLEAAGALLRLEQGETLFEVGQPADAFFVVVEGVVEVVAVRRGEARGTAVRRAVAGDAVGEDAVVRGGSSRLAAAHGATRARVVRVPVAIYRRVWDRCGGERRTQAHERALYRAAGRDVLLASSVAPAFDARQLERAVSVAEHRQLSRGDVLFERGESRTHVFVVADGMVSLETEQDGRVRIHGYVQRGDGVGHGTHPGAPHAMTARACGPVWALALPAEFERLRPDVWAERSRIRAAEPSSASTRHVGRDLWRYAVAGSMLVIDDEACVRCGHCASSCADTHGDGVSRLVRRGEKLQVHDAADGTLRALLVPGSCQHCKHPACMMDCPTGAIGRSAKGDVFVREDLCVGCGQCERACPWGSVHMAPRASPAGEPGAVGLSAHVAVKCDLCAALPAGPACVKACPVEAIARVQPLAAMADVRAAVLERVPRASLPRARAAWPWLLGAWLPALAIARALGTLGVAPLTSGATGGVLLGLLAAYSVAKRSRLARRAWMPAAHVHARVHLALGALAAGVVATHAGARVPANAAGGALLSFVLASVTGLLAALAYAVLPTALSRVEPQARLLEDLTPRARDLDERIFGALSGRSDASKSLYARVLAPYAAAGVGGLALLVSRRTPRQERERLVARLDAIIAGRGRHLEAMTDLVGLVVERRAVRAQRLLQITLRACVPLHVVSVAVALVLVAAHVLAVTRAR